MGEVINIQVNHRDGYITKVTHYVYTNKPKASILILHGMAEHKIRYENFANYLNSEGYDVYLYDHRGHGTDTKLNQLGFIAHSNGFKVLTQDVIDISNYIVQNNRSNKLFLFGHSMGSILARNVLETYDKYNGIILSGTNYPRKPLILFGLILSYVIKTLKGPKHISPFLNNQIFSRKKFTTFSKRTTFDWLTRSNPIVGAYIHDPYCGYICSASFYHDLLKLNLNAITKNTILAVRKELPFYIISGEKDPVGGYGNEVNRFINILKKSGFSHISSKLYPDCRHELLNELNKEEVYSDILNWISKRI